MAGAQAAAAVFEAPSGAVVGPVKTTFGWAVAKIDLVKTVGGKSIEQARSEIASKITADKKKNGIEDIVDKAQSAVDAGSNFTEAVAQAKLQVSTTPLITAAGTSNTDPNFKLPPELLPALKTGFELEISDPPEIVTLPNDQGYAMISPGQVIPAAPAPLAEARGQVTKDWIDSQAMDRARAAATQIEAKVEHGTPLADAMKASGVTLPAVRPLLLKRIQIANSQVAVPAPLKMLFTLGAGKSRMFPDPKGQGYFIVKVNKITPGNALTQPALIGQMQNELQQAVADDYVREFLSAMRKELGTKRNESAIQGLKTRMISSGG